MRLSRLLGRFIGRKQHFVPVFSQQSTYLVHAARALCQMTETVDHVQWRKLEKEVKACEVQGDAMLTEFHEQLYEALMRMSVRTDMQTLAMDLDDFLDHINDSAKSILLYMPRRIDPQIRDLAHFISAEADAIRIIMSLMEDMKRNYGHIVKQCERITELEHAADDIYQEYIGLIFKNESNPIELMKYKNIAEALESCTDAAKRVSDYVRKVILKYVE